MNAATGFADRLIRTIAGDEGISMLALGYCVNRIAAILIWQMLLPALSLSWSPVAA